MGRATIRTKSSRPTTTSSSSSAARTASVCNTKKTARQIRHASFVSRIEKKAAPAAPTTARKKKKKELAVLDDLVAALPDVNVIVAAGGSKKVLKSRPGAMKRKEVLLRSECERFGKNLAILEGGKGKGELGKGSWKMLRGFIGATIERKEEFVEMEKRKEGEERMVVDA